MSKYYYPLKKLVYSGEHKREISMPVGGIGTGCIGVASNGALVDYEIFSRTNKMSYNRFALFAVKAEIDGKVCDVRALETDGKITRDGTERITTEYLYSEEDSTKSLTRAANFPKFSESDFISSYPFGEIDFSHEKFPGKIHMIAWNPLIPLNDTDSGIPAVFMEYQITNDTDKIIEYTFYGMLKNPFNNSVNSFGGTRNDSIKYIKLTSSYESFSQQEKGEMCIGVCGNNIKYQEYLLRNDNFDNLQSFFNDINVGDLVNRSYPPDKYKKDTCAISSKVSLAPGEKDKIRFIISWYTSYSEDLLKIVSKESDDVNHEDSPQENLFCEMDGHCEKGVWKNYYTRYFTGADECIYYCLSQWERLYEETDMYRQLLFSSTLPNDIIEAVSVNVAALKSPVCVRIRDGSLYMLDGNGNVKELCDSTCNGIWDYGYAHSYLFPNIKRSVLKYHYTHDIGSRGSLSFVAKPPSVFKQNHNDIPFFDAKFWNVLNVYREFKLCGNIEWLASIWKDVVKSIEFAWHPDSTFKWSPDKTGHIAGRQYHTLSTELLSANCWLDSFYIAALKAAAEMAVVMKDKKHAEIFKSLYEKGAVICSYPEGFEKPKIPIPYAEECMNGFEYQVASHMIMNGMVEEGLEIVHGIRKRYDGTTRNPFNEMECGMGYAQSMSSYALLGALCGQTIDVYNKSYRFCPDMRFAEKGVFRCMVCFDNFLGYVERGIDYIQLNCLKGSIKVRRIEVPDVPLKVKCSNLEIGFDADRNTAILDNDCEVNPSRDLLVIFKIND